MPRAKSRSEPIADTVLTFRLDFPGKGRLGPGKVRLLELIDEHGSISAAGRAMGMSYRRAWQLIDELNRIFTHHVIETKHGGVSGHRKSVVVGKNVSLRVE